MKKIINLIRRGKNKGDLKIEEQRPKWNVEEIALKYERGRMGISKWR